jgi:hypothetical protein
MRRKVAMFTSNVLSVPYIVMETELVATLPFAVVTRFTSITSAWPRRSRHSTSHTI